MIKNLETYHTHRDLLPVLLWMQSRGICVNQTLIKEKAADLLVFAAERQEQLNIACGEELNVKSPKQIQGYFYGTKRLQPYKDRKTGKPTVDEEALKRIARRGFPEADLILDIRHAEKLRSTYFEVRLSDDGRLRSSFGFTRGGRLTSSTDIFGEGLNLQTMPHEKRFLNPDGSLRLLIDFREIIQADPGCMLYNIDKAQAENRIVAYIAPDLNMIDAFERGVDIHKKTASLIFNKPVELISGEDGSCSLGNGSRSERYFGKEANHALNYGLGVKHFALRLEIPEIQATMIRDKYFSGYPGVRVYHNWVLAKLRKDRCLTNVFGRTYEFFDRIGEDTLSDALYFIPQSTVADMINRWGLLYVWNNQDLFPHFELLNQVHDAIMFQLPISLGWEEHWRQINLLLTSLNKPLSWNGRTFSIPTDLKIGRSYGSMDELKGKRVNKDDFQTTWTKYAS